MEAYAAVLTYAIPGFVLLIIIESLVALRMGKKINRPMDTISSLSSGMTNTLKAILGIGIAIVSYDWLERHLGVFNITSQWWLYLLAFVGHDFAGYWSHRFNHRINVFWNRHIIHHSSEEFNLSCALRQEISALFGVYFIFYVPMALLGIPAEIVAVVAPIHLFAQFWYHTQIIGKMGWLENILVTPSHHRVHHAINAIYIDKNFSEIFIIWDKIFGTFQPELDHEPAVYGTKRPANTWNPLIINFMHLGLLIRDAFYTKKWVDKLRLWFMPTGWRPKDVSARFPVKTVEDVFAREKYDTPCSHFLLVWSWLQLIFVNIILFLLLLQLTDLDKLALIGIVAFLFITIFSYTALMDGHWASLLGVGLQCLVILVLVTFGASLSFLQVGPLSGPAVLTTYALLSLMISLYLLHRDFNLRLITLPMKN